MGFVIRNLGSDVGSDIYKLCDDEQIFNLSDLPVVLYKNRSSRSPHYRELVWGLQGIKGRTGYRTGARDTLVPISAPPLGWHLLIHQAQFRHCLLMFSLSPKSE